MIRGIIRTARRAKMAGGGASPIHLAHAIEQIIADVITRIARFAGLGPDDAGKQSMIS